MADIDKCIGTNCPYKETCHRFTAWVGEYKSYFTEPPIKDGNCEMYWGPNAEAIWKQLNEIIETKK